MGLTGLIGLIRLIGLTRLTGLIWLIRPIRLIGLMRLRISEASKGSYGVGLMWMCSQPLSNQKVLRTHVVLIHSTEGPTYKHFRGPFGPL